MMSGRFWSEEFLRGFVRCAKPLAYASASHAGANHQGNVRIGHGERRNCCEGKIIREAYLREVQDHQEER